MKEITDHCALVRTIDAGGIGTTATSDAIASVALILLPAVGEHRYHVLTRSCTGVALQKSMMSRTCSRCREGITNIPHCIYHSLARLVRAYRNCRCQDYTEMMVSKSELSERK